MTKVPATPPKHAGANRAQLVKEIRRLERRLHAAESVADERKRAEKALRLSEQNLSTIFHANPHILAITSLEDGLLYDVNDAYLAVSGHTRDEAIGRTAKEMKIWANPEHREQIVSLMNKQGFVRNFETEFASKDGRITPIMISIEWIEIDGERLMLSVSTDITERKQAEEKLRQAQKMEMVGQLTGGIAHDFNNLLAVVLGNLDLAADELEEEDKARGLVDAAIRGAERGAELTHRLLAFSRKQVLQPKAIDLNTHIEGMTDLLRRTLGEIIEIETMLADDLWRSVVDPGQIENTILNLAINARDAMPEGGKLTIETANKPLDDDYAAAQAEVTPGDYVMVAVSDSGTGMTQEVMTHVFEPFFTTKKVGTGSGLGLSMVYGFVKQSSGHVSIYSEVDEGTTIKLYLPRSLGKLSADAPSAEAGTPVGRGETVLVVEDDIDVRTLVVSLLSGLGYRVLDAKDGPTALAVLDRERGVNLILTDVVLPGGLTGPQLASEVRDRHGEIRVMYMSGYTENAIVHQGKLEPDVILLQKPFRKAELARKVRQALD